MRVMAAGGAWDRFPFGADPLEEGGGRFIGRVLGDKAALKGTFEDGLAKGGDTDNSFGFNLFLNDPGCVAQGISEFYGTGLLQDWCQGNGSALTLDRLSVYNPDVELAFSNIARRPAVERSHSNIQRERYVKPAQRTLIKWFW